MNELEELRQENAALKKRLEFYEKGKSAFAIRLKQIRVQSGITQTELSEKMGIKQPGVADYEACKREPTMSRLLQFADIFDVSLDWLCGRTENI